MLPLNEIIGTDEIQPEEFPEKTQALMAEVGKHIGTMTPLEISGVYQQHTRNALMFLAEMILGSLDQAGLLDLPVEDEISNVAQALEFDLLRTMYQYMLDREQALAEVNAARSQEASGLHVVRNGDGVVVPS